jgi:hypothetical protein
MKKLLIAAFAAFSLTAVNAEGIKAYVTADYITANSASKYEYHVGGAYKTPFGVFDGAVVGVQFIDANYNTSVGAEAGYSNSMMFEGVRLTGRVSSGGIASEWYYGLQGEAGLKIDPRVELYAQYRWRDGFSSSTASSNRYGVGADFVLQKDLALRVGYTFTDTLNTSFNGVSTALVASF